MNFNSLNLSQEILTYYQNLEPEVIAKLLTCGFQVMNLNCKKETEKKILNKNLLDLNLADLNLANCKITQLEKDKDELYGQINLIRDKERSYYLKKEREIREEINNLKMKLQNRYLELESLATEDLLNNLLPKSEITRCDYGFEVLMDMNKILYLNNESNVSESNVNDSESNVNEGKKINKRDLDKFRDMISKGDSECGIISSECGGIACKNDLDVEIINNKPIIFLHYAKKNTEKIRIAFHILANILQNNMELNTSMIQRIKDLIKETDNLGKLYTLNKNSINGLMENNEQLSIINRRVKYRLQDITKELYYTNANANANANANTNANANANANLNKGKNGGVEGSGIKGGITRKRQCEYCTKSFIDLEKHIQEKHQDYTL